MKQSILIMKWCLVWCLFIAPFEGTYAQLIAWQFGTPASVGNEVTYPSVATAVGMQSSALTRGGGVSIPTTLARGFGGTGFANGGTKTQAETSNAYYTFTVAARSGYSMSLSTLDAILRRSSATSPNTYCWKYSTDGVNFTQIGSDVGMTNTDAEGIAQTQIDLSGISALQNVAAGKVVTFRLYAWGAGSTSSTFGIGKTPSSSTAPSLAIGGTVVSENPPVASWHFNGKTGGEESADATSVQTGVSTATLTRGGGMTAATYARGFYSNNFTINGTKTNAETESEYLQVVVNAANDYKISLSSIDARVRGTSGGPQSFRWKYSIDGTNFTEIDDADQSVSPTSDGADGLWRPTVNLSGIAALQQVPSGTTITLRLYLWGATTATGSFLFGRYASGDNTPSLIIGGTIINVLPIKLSKFSAARKGTAIFLNWATSSEINVDKFEIERSQDGQHFEYLTDVKASNMPKGNAYGYIDENAFPMRSYYRLKTWDRDGSFGYSEVVYVKELLQQELVIYPNPVDKWLTIRYATTTSNSKLTITDMNGNKLMIQPVARDISHSAIDVEHLAKGTYLIILQSNNVSTVGKFIK